MIYFSCDHLFMLLWFIFLGTGLHAKGLGAGVGKRPPQPCRTLGGTLGHSCSGPAWERPPPSSCTRQPIPEDAAWLELHSLTPPCLPTGPLALEPRTRHAYVRTSTYAV